jgi:hypothetical protein
MCLCGPELRSPAPLCIGKVKLSAVGLAGVASWWVKIGLASLIACPRAMSEVVGRSRVKYLYVRRHPNTLDEEKSSRKEIYGVTSCDALLGSRDVQYGCSYFVIR